MMVDSEGRGVLSFPSRPNLLTAEHSTPPDSSMDDDYEIGEPLGRPGKEKTVHAAVRKGDGAHVAIAFFKNSKKSFERMRAEADFQRRAAALGIAPKVFACVKPGDFAIDPGRRGCIIMELLRGSTLKKLVTEQDGKLTRAQQLRLIEIYQGLGRAGICHGDAANGNNFVADAGGNLHVIDFGMASNVTREIRRIWGESWRLNMMEVGSLLFESTGPGRLKHLLTEQPDELIAAYRAYKREVHISDLTDPADRSSPPTWACATPKQEDGEPREITPIDEPSGEHDEGVTQDASPAASPVVIPAAAAPVVAPTIAPEAAPAALPPAAMAIDAKAALVCDGKRSREQLADETAAEPQTAPRRSARLMTKG